MGYTTLAGHFRSRMKQGRKPSCRSCKRQNRFHLGKVPVTGSSYNYILRGGAFRGRAADDRVVANAGGAVRVLKAVAAIDAGQIINPDGVISQTKGRAYPGDQLGAEGTDDVR